ncbi:MAG: 2-Oxobutyrate oxidase, putative, partial [uncultured Acetobacteraceae bacterium]
GAGTPGSRPRSHARRRSGRRGGAGGRVEGRVHRVRLLLRPQPRGSGSPAGRDLRRGGALPRHAAGREARGEDQRAQHRLHADAWRDHTHELARRGRAAQRQRSGVLQARTAARPPGRRTRRALPRPQPVARGPARLPRHGPGLLRRLREARIVPAADLRAGAGPPRRLLRAPLQGTDVHPPHVALPAAGADRARERIRHRAARGHQLHDHPGAEQGARPVAAPAGRELDGRARAGGRAARQRRHDAAALDQQPLPGLAAPRHQPFRAGALRHPLLHGRGLRRGDGADPARGRDRRRPADHLQGVHGRLPARQLRPRAAGSGKRAGRRVAGRL